MQSMAVQIPLRGTIFILMSLNHADIQTTSLTSYSQYNENVCIDAGAYNLQMQ